MTSRIGRRQLSMRTARACAYVIEQLEARRLLTAISSGERLLGNIASVGQMDTYTFDANVHESISIVVGGLSGANFFPRIQIFAPNGVAMNTAGTDFDFDANNLALTGTYSVVVRDDNNAQIGTYAISMIKTPGAQIVDADSGPITSNQRLTGAIDLGDQDVYTFSANANDSISVVAGFLSGANFFPRIQIFSPNGAPLNNFGTDFALDATNLPQGGTYFIVVRDDNNAQAGTYAITLIKTPGTQTLDADSGAIASNERRTGSIEAGDLDVYTINASAGESLSAVVGFVSGANFFPRIQVFAPNGVPLNSAGTDFQFDASNLPQTGTYYFVVRDDNNFQPGSYGITVIRTPGVQTIDSDSGAIASNERRTGSIEAGDLDVYTINASAGESVSAVVGQLSGANFFPRFQVFGPNGVPLNLPGTDFQFDASNLPLSGTYYFVVRDDNNLQTGTYAFTVIKTPGAQMLDADSGSIGSNQRREGGIELGDQDVYTFSANAGDSISAVVGALGGANFFPRFQLFAPNGVPLNSAATDFALDLSNLPQTGTYYMVVRDDNNLQSGFYALSVIKTPAAQTIDADSGAIASNQRREGMIDVGDQDIYTFDASAGDSITAVVGSLGGVNFFPRIQLFTPNGTSLNPAGTNSAFDAQNLSQTGTYFLVVRDDNNLNTGRYAISLARVGGAQVADTLDNDGGAISSPQARTAAIAAGDLDVYSINLAAGASVTFRMAALNGINFFPRLDVYAPNGVRLASQIASPVAITINPVPLDGTYYLVARDNNDLDIGNYSIAVDTNVVADTRPPEVTQTRFDFDTSRQQVVFTMNESVSGSVAAGDLTLENLTGAFTVPTANILASYNAPGHEVIFQFQNYPFLALPDGNYRATLNNGSVSDTAANVLPQAVSFEFFFLSGDANRDRNVNLIDFNILAGNFGVPMRKFSLGDFNYDATVNLIDFNLVAGKFGTTLPAPASLMQGVRRGGDSPFGDRPIGNSSGNDDALAAMLA